VAMNAIQRSMGQPDNYPFVLPPPVVEKLDFINGLVRNASG
ncbi:MAG TPA: putative zinc-binding metallopeptidase, partial [Shinella sp.]|nr:putative zinc-binding metallopeptidase [Shinella sp.]